MKYGDAVVVTATILREKWAAKRTRTRLANDCAALYCVAKHVAAGGKVNKVELKNMLKAIEEN